MIGAAAGVLGAAAGTVTTSAAARTSTLAATAPAPPLVPLWKTAGHRGILYGSSTATWQISDKAYSRLYTRHPAILFTEDDMLWYRLKPTPKSDLDFTYPDQIVEYAEDRNMLVFGAHLVWDEGFGDGWSDSDLWDIHEKRARKLLYGTMRRLMHRYRGRVAIWSVVNEAIVNGPDVGFHGLRTDVPWYHTIGPEYVAHAFHVAHEVDPRACLVMNDFGYETINQYGDKAVDKQRHTLQVLDRLLGRGVPVDAFGIQAHLLAERFADRFHTRQYRRFLSELADRGLKILITEMDVLDDGLPRNPSRRDAMVADVYRRYLDCALDEPAVASLITFGLSDRYTWLQEDYPREDGAARRPLPFNAHLKPKPAFHALHHALRQAPRRWPMFDAPRHVNTKDVPR
jgi:endo-1,4-beta-xylanase